MKPVIKILFVEDSSSDFELAKREIKKSGFEFDGQLVETREAYKEALLSFAPDIILSDYSLPQFNGLDALEIRKKVSPTTPFILVTGALNEETAVDVMKAGCDDYILKQNLTRLGPAIKSAIEKWEAIKAKKHAEDLLIESEERFKMLFNKAPIAYQSLNEDGFLIEINDTWSELLGYPKDAAISRWFGDFLTPGFAEKFRERFSVFKTIGKVHTEFEMIKKEGGTILVEFDGRIAHTPSGEFKQTHCVLNDITERRRSEEKIRELSQAVEQSPASIVITDLKGAIEYTNPKFTDITGYTAQEALGKNPKILKTGETASEDYTELWRTITSGKEWRGVFHNKKKNGELYWESASISPIKNHDGKTTHYLAVKEDITERKNAEEALRESEEKFREMASLLPQMVFEADILGNLTYVNERAFEIFQYSSENFNQGINFLELLIPEDIERAKENIRNVLAGEKIYNVEYTAIRKDGSRVPILTFANPIMKVNKPVGIRGVIVDITERKEAEEKLRISEERLRKFMDSAADSFALFDSKLNFIDINKAAEANFGLKKKKIVGKNIDLIYPNFKETEDYIKYMEVMKTGQPVSDNADTLGPKIENQSTKRTVFKVGEGIGIITTDTTENEKAEEAIWESEMKLKKATKIDLIGDWELNLINSQFHCSESIFKMFEIDQNKFEGTFSAFHNVMHPDDRGRVNAVYDESLLNKTPYEITYRLLTLDGRIKWFVEFCRTDYDANGKPFRSLGIVHDITERKQAKR